MKGTRPLTNAEVRAADRELTGHRGRALFATMLYTGARISETLALDVIDVLKPGDALDIRTQIVFRRSMTKGKRTGRVVDVHPELRARLLLYLDERRRKGTLGPIPVGALFLSRQGKRLSRTPSWEELHIAFVAAGLHERVSAHSLRKTVAQRLFDRGASVPVVQELLGHHDIYATMAYLNVKEERCKAAIASLPSFDEEETP